MGGRGRYDDEPRRPRHPAATRHAAAGECSNGCGDHFSGGGKAGCGHLFPSQPSEAFEELRRASAGGTANYWYHVGTHPARGRNILRVPAKTIRALRGFFWIDLARGTAKPVSTPFRSAMPWRSRMKVSALSDDGPDHRSIPDRNTDAPDRGADDVDARGFCPDSSLDGANVWNCRWRPCQPDYAAREGGGEGTADAIHPHGHFVRSFSLRGRGSANLLTNPALDPISRMPEFKVCAVRIEKGNTC